MSAQVSVTTSELPTLATITDLKAAPQPDGTVLVTFKSTGAKTLLATDELIRGFVEVKNGAGNFILHDVSADFTITLTPYSAADQRGIASSIRISATGDIMSTPKAPNTGFVSSRR